VVTKRSRRSWYGPTLLAGLAGAGAVVVGASRPWVIGSATTPGLPVVRAGVDGASLAPLAAALGYVLLAGFGAVIATRGWGRRIVGAAIVVAALVIAIQALVVPADVGDALRNALRAKGYPGAGGIDEHISGWRWVCLAGALVAAISGSLVVRLGSEFAVMGARYDAVSALRDGADAPNRIENHSETDIWRAIDRGDDPTGEG
jgi:uncharacterized membrane protein (TIGR02234 family)